MPDVTVHELRLVLTVDEFDRAAHAGYIDEVEVGRRCAGHVRVALGVAAVAEHSRRLADAGVAVVAPPIATPFGSTNARFELSPHLQLTLFG